MVKDSRRAPMLRRRSTTKLRGEYGLKKDWRAWRTDQRRTATYQRPVSNTTMEREC
jgi:hypothetical protein